MGGGCKRRGYTSNTTTSVLQCSHSENLPHQSKVQHIMLDFTLERYIIIIKGQQFFSENQKGVACDLFALAGNHKFYEEKHLST